MLPKVRKYGVIAALGLVAVGVMMSRHGISCSSADARETVGNIALEHKALLSTIRYGGKGASIPAKSACEQDAACGKALQELNSAKAAAIQLAQQCKAIAAVADTDDLCPELAEASQAYSIRGRSWGTTIYGDDGFEHHDSARREFMSQRAEPIFARWIEAEAAQDAAAKSLERGDADRVAQAWTQAAKNVEYQLENVIMTATDKDTGSVSCKADLVGEIPDWGKATQQITYTVEKTSDGDLYATIWGI